MPPELTVTGPDGQPTPLLDLDGKPVQLAALRGKAVWLNFWASWCPPCQFETPVLRDVADAYATSGLEVVGVSVRETSVDDVRAYADKYQLDYTIAADVTRRRLRRVPALNGIPTSFFIGPEGAIHAIVNGPLTEASPGPGRGAPARRSRRARRRRASPQRRLGAVSANGARGRR